MDVHDQVGFIHRESSKGDLFVILVLNPFNLYFVSLLSVTPFNVIVGEIIGAFCLLFQML